MARKKPGDVIEKLRPEETRDVLRRLLAARRDLMPEVERLVDEALARVLFKNIADRVEQALRSITLDEMRDRAGQHAGGYTTPKEAALHLMEEAVRPFQEDMLRRRELGREVEAMELCKGIVLGLYRLRDRMGSHEILQWCAAFPSEHARWVVKLWNGDADEGRGNRRRTAPRRTLPREFVEKYVPEWDGMAGPRR
jgi:hypothetical protein